MFEAAYQVASKFTHPILISRRTGNGNVSPSLGAWVVLNEEWGLTAAHMIQMLMQLANEKERSKEYETKLGEIETDDSIEKGKRKKLIRELAKEYNPNELTTDFSQWLGLDGIRISGDVHIDAAVDLAVFQYSDAPDEWGKPYPFLRDDDFRPGVSVLRYGYPFHTVTVGFNEQTRNFDISAGLPVPVFPIEGMTTRRAGIDPPHEKYPRSFLETSSPGLKGQSGGPIVDRDGTIWAIQSRTMHLPLGFNPKLEKDGREYEEHQFLNVGWGADAATIKGLLDHHGISFQSS